MLQHVSEFHSFLRLNDVVWRDHILFVHSSISGHFRYSHILALMNDAALNIAVRVSESLLSVVLGVYLGSFLKNIYIFIYLFIWLHQVLVVARGIFVAAHGLLSSCGTWAPEYTSSVAVARGLSDCGSRALERRLSSCGARA